MPLSVDQLRAMGLSGSEIAGYQAAAEMDQKASLTTGGAGNSGLNSYSWGDAYLQKLGLKGGGSSSGGSGSGSASQPDYGASPTGLTDEQSSRIYNTAVPREGDTLAQYDPATQRLTNYADNGLLSPAEESAQIAAAKSAQIRAGDNAATGLYNQRLAGGMGSPLAAAAVQSTAAANAAYAGTQKRSDILDAEAKAKYDATGALLGVADKRASIMQGTTNTLTNTAAKDTDPSGTASDNIAYQQAMIDEQKKQAAANLLAAGKKPSTILGYGR